MRKRTQAVIMLILALQGCQTNDTSDTSPLADLRGKDGDTAPIEEMEEMNIDPNFLAMMASIKILTFCDNPTIEEFRSIERFLYLLKDSELMSEKDQIISAVFLYRAAEKYEWDFSYNSPVFQMAEEMKNEKSILGRHIRNDEEINPHRLDIWWGSFFATGEIKYVENLLRFAGRNPVLEDPNLSAVIQAATWSFSSNAPRIQTLQRYCKELLQDEEYTVIRTYLEECLSRPKDS